MRVDQSNVRPIIRYVREHAHVLVAFTSSRLLVFSVMLLSRLIVIPGPFSHRGGFLTTLLVGGGVPFLQVARDGYPSGPGSEWGMSIFPVYPLLVKIVSLVFHNVAVAGIVAANLSLLGAGVLLDRLIKTQHGNPEAAHAGVIFLMFNPATVFYTGAHPASTFLALAIASLYAAAKGRWLLASLCGMALAAAHQIGVVIVLPLLAEFVQQGRLGEPVTLVEPTQGIARSSRWKKVPWLALIPLATAAFIWFGYAKFPDTAAVSNAIRGWIGSPAYPWSRLVAPHGTPRMYSWLLPPILGISILLWMAGFALRIRLSAIVYATLLVALYMCSTTLEATPRTVGLVFPLFIALGLISARWKWTYEPLLATSAAALSFCTMVAANGYWMR